MAITHYYTIYCSNSKIKIKKHIYPSRLEAEQYMYYLSSRLGLKRSEIWCDNHDKTYCFTGGTKFYIQRM